MPQNSPQPEFLTPLLLPISNLNPICKLFNLVNMIK